MGPINFLSENLLHHFIWRIFDFNISLPFFILVHDFTIACKYHHFYIRCIIPNWGFHMMYRKCIMSKVVFMRCNFFGIVDFLKKSKKPDKPFK